MLLGSSHVQTSPVYIWAPLVGAGAVVVAHPASRRRIAAVVRAFITHLRWSVLALRRLRRSKHTNAVPGRRAAGFGVTWAAHREADYREVVARALTTPSPTRITEGRRAEGQ